MNRFGQVLGGVAVAALLSVDGSRADELDSLLSGFEVESEKSEKSGNSLDNLMDGFEVGEEDVTDQDNVSDSEPVLPDWLSLQGSLSLAASVNFAHSAPQTDEPDYRGLSMLRGHGELIGDMTFGGWKSRVGATTFYDAAYHLNGQRDAYTSRYLGLYESEFEINEAYLQGGISNNLDLKIGRQIVVWGKSDNIRITDVLNPLDRRYPGMLDIRYLRLPVTLSKVDYFLNNWNLSGVVIHEPRAGKFPVYNGEFFPGDQAAPSIVTPSWSWENQQPGLAVNGMFSGWDISFYLASVFTENGSVQSNSEIGFYRTLDKATMVGTAANLVFGSWLVKGEAAYWDGIAYTTSSEEKSRLDLLVGLEFAGFAETTISLEIANRHIYEFEQQMEELPDGQQEDWSQYAVRFVRDFLNDKVQLTALLSSFGLLGADGGFERIQLDYDMTDNVTITGGVVFYQSGDYPGFSDIGDNDRILLELEYRF